MSCNYADSLSPYENKGKLGLPESFDSPDVVEDKVEQLKQLILQSKHSVVFTGAGISTAAGIPDFRGPKGVWTLEKKGLKPDSNVSWEEAKPTVAHLALVKLVQRNHIQFVVSQNIDGLHMRSGLDRSKLAELHGNMFVDSCTTCRKMFVRPKASATVGQKCTGAACPAVKANGRRCRGKLCDFVLDWEASLPEEDLDLSLAHSTLSRLSIVIGSTLQIVPAATMPTMTKKYQREENGKLVIINLQPTKHDDKADLIIRCYADQVFERLMKKLGYEVPQYCAQKDPIVKAAALHAPDYVEWTQNYAECKRLQALSDQVQLHFRQQNPPKARKKARIDDCVSDSETCTSFKKDELADGLLKQEHDIKTEDSLHLKDQDLIISRLDDIKEEVKHENDASTKPPA